jgi:hypothetical protein
MNLISLGGSYETKEKAVSGSTNFYWPFPWDHCRIYFLEDDEWVPFLYDYSQKRIVTQENRKMPFMERYRRYVALVPEDTFTVVYETN